jgi:hypothetical protein
VKELDLPERFVDAMNGRLGRAGVFVEVNGRFYLSEERLKEVKESLAARRGW